LGGLTLGLWLGISVGFTDFDELSYVFSLGLQLGRVAGFLLGLWLGVPAFVELEGLLDYCDKTASLALCFVLGLSWRASRPT
jgi:hypothetical protein